MDQVVVVQSSRAARSERDREDERQRVREWLDALDDVAERFGVDGVARLMGHLERRAFRHGVVPPAATVTPHQNTLPAERLPAFDGDLALERRIEAVVRWNAMAMVVRANRRHPGIGGHVATYASAATLFEVGFNHVFRGDAHPEGRDLVFFQGHAAPGVYARAFLEGRLDPHLLDNFRRELDEGGGLSSYPHPWLMPEFWEMPTVSMGLSPIMAIYAARFSHYLAARGLIQGPRRVWALLGDGEMDEPESVGALAVAAQFGLDNLGFIINCNLQRLDGPVRVHGRIIDELEGLFAGAGWRVIKVLWGRAWEPLLAADADGALALRLQELDDLDLQAYVVRGGAHVREHFFGDRTLARMVADWDDDALLQLFREGRGGHDIQQVWAAYRAAEATAGQPAVILAQTVKGLGLGAAGEGRNTAHKAQALEGDALREFRDRLGVPVSDDDLDDIPYVQLSKDAPEVRYALARRDALGGAQPRRSITAPPLPKADPKIFRTDYEGAERPATTTMVLVRLLSRLLRDRDLGPRVVPIIPDEARTFGVEALFPQVGIFAEHEPGRDPVDAHTLTPYAVRTDGQILEEGISEAGSVASAIAAGTAHVVHGIQTVPFFFFYSMFGFQRVGDLLWAAADARTRAFLIGATSGRTTLEGEGLQHQDGHSHVLALTHPRVRAYDPAFGYEVATLVEEGLCALGERGEDLLYYLTVNNEPGSQPPRPVGVAEGIRRGMYRLQASSRSTEHEPVQLLASGPMVRIAQQAQAKLEQEFDLAAEVWSVTSWTELYRDASLCERYNRLHPCATPKRAYLQEMLGSASVVVAVSDWMKALPDLLGRWMPPGFVTLGTDGLGRSDGRGALRAFFEVDVRHVVQAAVRSLAALGRCSVERAEIVTRELGIMPDIPCPTTR